MAIFTPHIKRIIHRNEGRKHSGCKAKRHLPKRSFDAYFGNTTGIANLSTSITLNSVTVVPRYFYRSADLASINQDADTCSWPSYAGSGATLTTYGDSVALDLTTGVATCFDDLSDGILFPASGTGANSDVSKGGINSVNDIDPANGNTFDFVLEMTAFLGSGVGVIFGLNNTVWTGYALEINANRGLSFWLCNSAGVQIEIASNNNTIVANSWNHILLIADRSGAATYYVNGKVDKTVTISSFTSTTWTLGSGGFSIGDSSINHVAAAFPGMVLKHLALWSSNGWLDSSVQDAFVRDRYADLIQLHPDYCNGTALVRSL